MFPGSQKLFRVSLAAAASAAVLATAAEANTLLPTFMSVDVPVGTQGSTAPQTGLALDTGAQITITDDVYLNTLQFGATSFSGASAYGVATELRVLSNRGQVNIEWGDDDGRGANGPEDGDFNPMAKIGQPDALKETTDPAIQDAGLLTAFNTLSLTEMTDGEGGAAHSFGVLFDRGVRDNDLGDDDTPEIVMFERGGNDRFQISLILDGDLDNPTLSNPLQVDSGDFARTGMRADTTEIGSAQDVVVAGFDLNAWGLDAGQSIFGFVYSGTGADLSGIFASSNGGFVPRPPGPELPAVPLPTGVWLMLSAMGGFWIARRRSA